MEGSFISDVQELRRRARMHIENGAVTEAYGANLETAVKLLNEALATEIVCTLRYRYHYYMAKGIHAQAAQQEFLEHANEEQQHADSLAARIVQLGGKPDFNPDILTQRSHAEYVEGDSLEEMLREDGALLRQQRHHLATAVGADSGRRRRTCGRPGHATGDVFFGVRVALTSSVESRASSVQNQRRASSV